MEANVMKIPEDSDFRHFSQLCNSHQGWISVYHKIDIRVWTKPQSESSFNMIKVRANFPGIHAVDAYDVLHDPKYRVIWDKYMCDSRDIGFLNPNNDVCYYAIRSITPFQNRDFVLQRSWLDLSDEKLIFSRSICHDDFPPRNNFIRAISYLTGFLIRSQNNGCQITYIAHSNPKGNLPSWLANKVVKTVAPEMIKRLYKACVNYPEWKAVNLPNLKPWSRPDQQIGLPRVLVTQCRIRHYDDQNLFDGIVCEDDS